MAFEKTLYNIFLDVLSYLSRFDMRVEIREIRRSPSGERIIGPWCVLLINGRNLYWTDESFSHVGMDQKRSIQLDNTMSFELSKEEGKMQVKDRKTGLYLQMRIEVPDVL